MFLREIKQKSGTYLYLVKSYRDGKRIRHKSMGVLGKLETLRDSGQLERLSDKLRQLSGQATRGWDLSSAKEVARRNWGAVAVVKKLWELGKLSKFFLREKEGRKIQFDVERQVRLMVLDRLVCPKSKLRSYEEQAAYFGLEACELPHLYRALDFLGEKKAALERHLFSQYRDLFNQQVDVVLYDVTTLYFESVKEDVLRTFGYSKDGKAKEVQVVMGLIVDQEGRPIGFDVFAGNTFEGHTLDAALQKLQARFSIRQLIVIGDQAMFSKENLKLLKRSGYGYIVGGRIKSRSQAVQAKIFDLEGYQEVPVQDPEEKVWVKPIALNEDTLVCWWSKKRAEKDRTERERAVRKAKALLEAGQGPGRLHRGALRYIEVPRQGQLKLNEEKIQADMAWDGFYGVQVHAQAVSAEKAMALYHDLWRIEEAFRLWKHHLEARPMFHWTPKRIQGHLVLCFIALFLQRLLEDRLKQNHIPYSPPRIRKALRALQVSEILVEDKPFMLRAPVEGLANDILRCLHIKIPPNITPKDQFPTL